MSSVISHRNTFLSAPLGPLFTRTALPIVMIMSMTGLFSVVDAIFLGLFVGRDAVSAVTVIFPVTMLLFAVSALVSGGMSSLLARRLGANDIDGAGGVFAAAHGLGVAASLLLVAMFLLIGDAVTLHAAAGNTVIADMAHAYLGISVLTTPLMFFVALHSDGLRNEGRAPLLALLSVLVTIANIGFNYLFIAILDLGVAGSAYGTVAAQLLAIIMIIVFRTRAMTPLPLTILCRHPWWRAWGTITALGAPQCLSYIGISLVSGTVIAALQVGESNTYAATVAAYGIITRIFGFAFLPMLGIAMAMQSIVGNNVGAGLHARSDTTLRYALSVAGVYCLVVQMVLITCAAGIGGLFVDDAVVIAEVGRILPQLVLFYLVSGPLLTLASYFQAIGDAARAATLSLVKPFLLSPVLIIALSAILGEPGIWVASPLADGLMIVVVLLVLARAARRTGRRMGVYLSTREAT